MTNITIKHNGYTITTDKSLMDVPAIHKWLSEESYWVKDIALHNVKKSFDNSFCIGILLDNEQVGYGRLITDYASFAYMADVYVKAEHRGKGLAKMMIKIMLSQDWVMGLRGVMLGTRDAHDLYRQFGFTELPDPDRFMKWSNQNQ